VQIVSFDYLIRHDHPIVKRKKKKEKRKKKHAQQSIATMLNLN
jgi:hypothetical protein